MKTLFVLQREVHQSMVNMRAMDRLVRTEKFSQAFNLDPVNTRIVFAIKSGDVSTVEDWIKDTLASELELGEYNIKQLRAKAAALGIPYVTTLTKDQLLIRVAHVQRGCTEEAERMPHHGIVSASVNDSALGPCLPAQAG